MATRTGAVATTKLVEHLCRILAKYRPAINGVLAGAVAGGLITTEDANIVLAWLDGADTACAVFKSTTGY